MVLLCLCVDLWRRPRPQFERSPESTARGVGLAVVGRNVKSGARMGAGRSCRAPVKQDINPVSSVIRISPMPDDR